MSNIPTYLQYIDGQWISSDSGKLDDILNPSNEELVGRVQDGSRSDAEKALKAAKNAQKSWRKLPPRQRAALLYTFTDEIRKNADRLAKLLVQEQGKLLSLARIEVEVTCTFIEYL